MFTDTEYFSSNETDEKSYSLFLGTSNYNYAKQKFLPKPIWWQVYE